MPSYHVRVEWTQELSFEKEVEADDFETAKKIALGIDPRDMTGDQFAAGEFILGEVVSDIDAYVDGDQVGVNGNDIE